MDKLPDGIKKPSKLDTQSLNDVCFSDEFWELDVSFKCNEKWALNPIIRKAIDAMYNNLRAHEEIFILGAEADRYYSWLSSRLDKCQDFLRIIDVKSAIGSQVLEIGLRAASALERLGGLSEVYLGEDEKFESVQETINCKSPVKTCG